MQSLCYLKPKLTIVLNFHHPIEIQLLSKLSNLLDLDC
nr:MAG TPA: Protein of unknown function (DUF2787) [Bacteriophage sp.]